VAARIATSLKFGCCRERATSSTSSCCLDNCNCVKLLLLLLLLGPQCWHLMLLLLLRWLRPCIYDKLVNEPPCCANPTRPCLRYLSL
jgi:hypothetical protein